MLTREDEGGDRHAVTGPPLHVLICPDEPSWAFDNIANNIERFSGPNRLTKLYMKDVIGNERLLFETIFLKRIDLCHIFWREDLFYLLHPHMIAQTARSMGIDTATFIRAFNSCAFTTSVYDHLFSSPEEMRERQAGFAAIDGYTVSSRKLYDIYAAEPTLPTPDLIITDGVNVSDFQAAEASGDARNRAIIGWAGNASWGAEAKKFDVKGYHRLFRPMMAELVARGHAVEERAAIPQRTRIPFSEMPGFYQGLDLFICTSAIEGTPNTVLEAMACGIPVVSTDVGIVPEAFGELQRRFIIAEPDTDAFADAVVELLEDPGLRRRIAEENRRVALEWSWESRTKDWWPFWNRVVRHASARRNALRRELFLLAQTADG